MIPPRDLRSYDALPDGKKDVSITGKAEGDMRERARLLGLWGLLANWDALN